MEIFDFRWWVCLDGYRLEKGEPRFFPSGRVLPGGRSSFSLTNASGRFRCYEPLKIPALYARFAEEFESSAEGMQDFCRLYGLPGGGRPDMAPLQTAPKSEGVLVDVLLDSPNAAPQSAQTPPARRHVRADKLLEFLAWHRGNPRASRAGSGGQLELALIPPDLIQAMWLQLAQDACSGARLFRCQRCNAVFVVGTRTGRRSTAKWCSVNCRVEAHREESATMKGHIRERSPGHWAIVLDIRDPETGERRRKWHSFRGTKREAQIECSRLVTELTQGSYVEPSKTTLAVFLDTWLAHVEPSVAPRTLERYRRDRTQEPRTATWPNDPDQAQARADCVGLRQGPQDRPKGRHRRPLTANRPPHAPHLETGAGDCGALAGASLQPARRH